MATRRRAGYYIEVFIIDPDTAILFSILLNDERNDYDGFAKIGEWVVQYEISSVSRGREAGRFERSYASKKDALEAIDSVMNGGRWFYDSTLGWCYTPHAEIKDD